MIRFFKKFIPKLSETEKVALRSGTLSLDRYLFENSMYKHLNDYQLTLTNKEQSFLHHETEELCHVSKPYESFQRGRISEDQFHVIKTNGFMGLSIPEHVGGHGFSTYAHSRIVQKISSRCVSSAVTVMVPNSLGPAELLLKYGTKAQRDRYLPKLASGEMIPCFGLTGPLNGSDATGQLDKGRLIDETTIEFECHKRWITLAPIADLIGLALDIEGKGVTVLLLERDSSLFDIGNRHHPVGASFMNGPIRTKGKVRVSTDCVIGGAENLGKGWEMLMECLSEGRGISLPALSSGVNCYLSIYTSYYAHARQQFKLRLSEMQGVQEKLGNMIANTYLTLAMHELLNATLLKHETSSVLSAILKYKATELARETVNHSMDIFAGKGITMGPRNGIAHIYQQIPVAITVEGSNTLTRSLIIFGQGVNKSHPYVADILQAVDDHDEKKFCRLFVKVVGYVLKHYLSVLFKPRWTLTSRLEHRNAIFIVLSNYMLLKGKNLKKEQMKTGRMADLMTDLYAAYAVSWNRQFPQIENLLLHYQLHRIDQHISDICREEGFWLQCLLQPFWSTSTLCDNEWIKLSQSVLENEAFDSYLENYIYLDQEDPIVKYRSQLRNQATPSDDLVREIIQVDDFQHHISPTRMQYVDDLLAGIPSPTRSPTPPPESWEKVSRENDNTYK